MKSVSLAVLGLAAAAAALIFLDQPIAQFALDHRHGASQLAGWISSATSPMLVFSMLLILAVAEQGRHLGRHNRGLATAEANIPLRLLLCGAGASLIAWLLKSVIGRARPDIDQLDHLAFRVLAFNDSFGSLPSAQATLAASLAVMLSAAFPRYRGIIVIVLAIVCLARLLIPEHWLSDVILGLMLGAAIARCMPPARPSKSSNA